MIDETKTYTSKLAVAYKEGHYGQSLQSIINSRSFTQDIAAAIRLSIIKYKRNK